MSEGKPRSSKARVFHAAALILQAALALALLEAGLTLLGVADEAVANASRLPYQRIVLPLFEEEAGRFRANEPRLGSQSFAATKPEDTFRIFLLGGSALRGLGQSPGISIASLLQRCLGEASSAHRFEAINCGIVGIASEQVRAMCTDVLARYQPDLVIVCSGNNEFLETHAREYQRLEQSPVARALGAFTGRLRSLHLLRGLLPSPSQRAQRSAAGAVRMTADLFLETVEVSAPDVEAIVAAHAENLTLVADACRTAGVPLLASTVPASLRWGDPFPADEWPEAVLAAWNIEAAAWPPAGDERLAFIEAQAQERETSADRLARAELRLLRGKCQEARGQLDGARAAYLAAIDLDPHCRRTLGAMNDSIVALAQRDGVWLADPVRAFAALQPIPAARFFYDHIHFNPAGASVMATLYAARIEAAGLLPGDVALDADRFRQRFDAEVAELRARGEDAPAIDRWIGFDFDPTFIADTDLWKYDRGLERLLEMIATDDLAPARRGKALAYLGNHRAFDVDGLAEARRLFEEALPLVPEWESALRANLAWVAAR